ncbi:hypothetical protein VTL71DRAFT_14696 [Oculimacula yallundae]|uniref:Uncharacterized protein n=1 Tax=Oculimacula yallundae TaxID=86028 RepID=A0ABR4CJ73_9HELO
MTKCGRSTFASYLVRLEMYFGRGRKSRSDYQIQLPTMAGLAPIAMSQTKDDLLRHLNLPPATYALMAKETEVVYNWLIAHKSHLKENGKRKPPFDWSDIQERAKDDAMTMIAQGGDQYTTYYWDLGSTSGNTPNWVAKWFLYHKFRYRDGRNRSQKSGEKHRDKHGSSKHTHISKEEQSKYSYENEGMTADGSSSQGKPNPASSTSTNQYTYAQYDLGSSSYSTQDSTDNGNNGDNQHGTFYDPVRDI